MIHQSDLKSMARCGEQHRRQLAGERGHQLSATAFGSVMHHALHTLERHRDLALATNTFEHYWHPLNIDEICEPVDVWIRGQSFGTLRNKGIETLKRYWDLKRYDDEEVLALEFPFVVELDGTWDPDEEAPHRLAGTVDRLAVRYYRREMHVCIDDWKTGKKPVYLKHNVQFSAYGYASTRQEFWTGHDNADALGLPDGFGEERGYELYRRLENAPRHGWWINVMGGPDWIDAGVRNQARDYRRLLHSVDQYVRARKARIFQLNIDGSTCEFCPFRDTCPEGIDQ